jgi:hypothetical protein
MLSPKTLERVSASYRRGYYDGHAGKPAEDAKASAHPFDRPFANADYAAGHEAGANDRKWSEVSRSPKPRPQGRSHTGTLSHRELGCGSPQGTLPPEMLPRGGGEVVVICLCCEEWKPAEYDACPACKMPTETKIN